MKLTLLRHEQIPLWLNEIEFSWLDTTLVLAYLQCLIVDFAMRETGHMHANELCTYAVDQAASQPRRQERLHKSRGGITMQTNSLAMSY